MAMTTPTESPAANTSTFAGPGSVAQHDSSDHHTRHPNPSTNDHPDFHQHSHAQSSTSQNRMSTGSRVLGVTGPAGESGLPPSRPSSIATSGHGRANSQAAHPSRGLGRVGSTGGSVTGSLSQSRPTTSASRTHVPLAAHGFFRPMSSQRLQQQRNQRPTSLLGHTALYVESSNESGGNHYRHSIGSNNTIKEAPLGLHRTQDEPPPPSRGTDFSDRDLPDRNTANSTPTGAETVRSQGESITPLQRPPKPQHLDLSKNYKTDSGKVATPSKSPRSFTSNFLLPSREGRLSLRPQEGHEKLTSAESSPRMARKETPKEVVKRELGKNYQYFAGNTAFCWGGRLQNTRDRPVNIATALLIVAPTALFLGFSAPWLWLNVSPAIPITFAYLFLICISSFIHATASDPGILPRNLHPFAPPNPNDDPLSVGPPTTEWTMVVSAAGGNAAMEVPTKFCKSCNIWRPPRAHHCRVCDNCIETQDHHCVWLNNCIGRRNYRYFFTFVMSATILGVYLLAASLTHILLWRARNRATFGDAISEWRVPFAMCIYAVLGAPYPLSLGLYHLFLMARGETTREYLNSHKFLKKDRHRPFTQESMLKNWIAVLIRPRPPTYLQFKSQYEDGDQRFGKGVEMQAIRTEGSVSESRQRRSQAG
ncbi:unnamed protein product [Periconia digitata]|uniref:Palmitoyltransferase n=1 Tax=Periconia digitata TaxID=1303443 RepID=A0A9W4UMR4_9PLEO|nr:unnamed protein product [Periconia digitata]